MNIDELILRLELSRICFDPAVNDYYGTESRDKVAVIHHTLLTEVVTYLRNSKTRA